MLVTTTSTGTLLIQSGDDAVELTHHEAATLYHVLPGYLASPFRPSDEDRWGEDRWGEDEDE